MKLDLVISAPAPGFGPLEWQGGRGVGSVHLLNMTALFVAVLNDSGITIEIVPPWTRAELSLEDQKYAHLTFQDAGLGSLTAPAGVTGAALYAGGTDAKLQTRQFPFSPAASGTSGGGGGAPATQGPLTDRSGTIITGGVTQLITGPNANRHYLFVVNLSTDPLWINFGSAATTAAPSIPLIGAPTAGAAGGGSFSMEGTFISTDDVYIIGATTGDVFVAKEG